MPDLTLDKTKALYKIGVLIDNFCTDTIFNFESFFEQSEKELRIEDAVFINTLAKLDELFFSNIKRRLGFLIDNFVAVDAPWDFLWYLERKNYRIEKIVFSKTLDQLSEIFYEFKN